MNRLLTSTQSVYSVSSVVQNSYDLNGNRTNIVYPGGLSVSYEYDEENRLRGTTLTGSTISTPLTFSFGYDGASRLTNIVYPNTVVSKFGYDAENRVTNYTHGAFVNHVITRDPRGFKTREDIYAGLIPNFTNGLRQTRSHNDADQLLTAGADEYAYDSNGNLTNSAWGTYEWDYNNRLIAASGVQYLYDASGARIGRIANNVTNYFVLDYRASLKMPLAETDAQGNITRYYIWSSHGLLAHLDVDPNTQAITSTRFYHKDELGSTLALTDETGDVTDQFAYTPYGRTTHQNLIPGTSDLTPFLWLGGLAVRGEGNGLYYMLNRYYSADMRRFISSDPLGIDGGANLYVYCENNPVNFVDPFGLDSVFFYVEGTKNGEDSAYLERALPGAAENYDFSFKVKDADELISKMEDLAAAGVNIDYVLVSDHGAPGLQGVGASALTPFYAEMLGDLMSEGDGLIELLGCDVGADEDFVQKMANRSQKNVLAYDGKVGFFPFGDWLILHFGPSVEKSPEK